MKKIIFTIAILLLFNGCTKKSNDDNSSNTPKKEMTSVDNAHKLCEVLVNTGQECSVSEADSSVKAYMNTSSIEANKICFGISSSLSEKGIIFDRGWKLKIYSPINDEDTIAQCDL